MGEELGMRKLWEVRVEEERGEMERAWHKEVSLCSEEGPSNFILAGLGRRGRKGVRYSEVRRKEGEWRRGSRAKGGMGYNVWHNGPCL